QLLQPVGGEGAAADAAAAAAAAAAELTDLKKPSVTPSERDLRLLLVKDLRYLLSSSKEAAKELLPFKKAEAAARLKQISLLLQRLALLGARYEQQLLHSLRGSSSSKIRKITKLFITNITEEAKEYLIAPEFFSAQLQQLLLLVLQLQPQQLSLQRQQLQAAADAYMLNLSMDKKAAVRSFFVHVQQLQQQDVQQQQQQQQLLLSDAEAELVLDIVALLWDSYYSHSVEIIEALKFRENGVSGQQQLLQQQQQQQQQQVLQQQQQALAESSSSRTLDRYGFLAAAQLLLLLQQAPLARVSLLLPSCRLLHASSSKPLTFAAAGSFAVSLEFRDFFSSKAAAAAAASPQQTAAAASSQRAAAAANQKTNSLFSLVINQLTPQDLNNLFSLADEPVQVESTLELVQLTPVAASSLRQTFSLEEQQAPSLKQLLGVPAAAAAAAAAVDERLFEGIFLGSRLELRALLN
ncbi:hypothetical protein, conserved, partial [Eimeria tenella]